MQKLAGEKNTMRKKAFSSLPTVYRPFAWTERFGQSDHLSPLTVKKPRQHFSKEGITRYLMLMDWLGELSNFVMGATAHFVATVTAKILNHPDLQEAFAKTIALGVQKFLTEGPTSSGMVSKVGTTDNSTTTTTNTNTTTSPDHHQQQQLLRILGKWLLAIAEPNQSRDKKRSSKRDADTHSTAECTDQGTTPKVVRIKSHSSTTPMSTPTRPVKGVSKVDSPSTFATRESVDEDFQEYLC